MNTVKQKQFNGLPYVAASLALIIVAIVFSGFLNSRESAKTSSADTRARAGSPGLVKVEAIVSEIHETEGTIVVDNLHFVDGTKNLGTWTVTTPPRLNLFALTSGTRILITVDPPTMIAQKRTLTAKEIVISR